MRKIRRFLHRLQTGAIVNRRVVLGVLLVMAVLTVAGLRELRFDFGLPATGAATRELQRAFARSFPEAPQLFLVLQKPGGAFAAADLCRARDWIREHLFAVPGIEKIETVFSLRTPEDAGGELQWPRVVRGDDCAGAPPALPALPFVGEFFDPASRDFFFIVSLKEGQDEEALAAVTDGVEGALREAPFLAHAYGVPFLKRAVRDGMIRLLVLNLLSLLAIALIVRAVAGSWRLAGLALAILIATILFTHGMMGLWGARVDMISIGITPLLTLAILEDLLFLLWCRYRWRGSRIFRRVLLGGFLTSFTTVIGFGSLVGADHPSVRVLGVFSAVGALTEWAFFFLAAPALLPASFAQERDPLSGRLWHWCARLSTVAVPKKIAYLIVAVPFVLLAFAHRPNVDHPFLKLFPASHSLSRAESYLRASRDWNGIVGFGFERTDPAREKKLADLRALPEVRSVIGGAATLAPTLARVGEEYRPGVEGMLRYSLPQIYGIGPFDKAYVFLRDMRVSSLQVVADRVRTLCPAGDCFLTGDFAEFADDSNKSITLLIESLVASGFLVGGILVVTLLGAGLGRRWIGIIFPTAWGLTLTYAILCALQIPLSATTCIFASILAGMTGDNSFQFLGKTFGRSYAAAIDLLAPAATMASVTMIIAVLPLLFAPFIPLRDLSILLVVGFAGAWLGDVVLQSTLNRE